MNLLKDIALYYSIGMGPVMDQFLRLYDKDDHPSYGMCKISLDEVADALGYVKGLDNNLRPDCRILHEVTNDYLVKHRDFITVKMTDATIAYTTRFYNKHALLLIAMLCKKHGQRSRMRHRRLMLDNIMYLHAEHSFFSHCPTRCIEPSDHSGESEAEA